MLAQYGHVLLYLIMGTSFGLVNLAAAALLRFYSGDKRQKIPYECGMEPIGSPYTFIDIRFYLFALLFVAFDVEALFMFPWAVVFRDLGWPGFAEMVVFIGILFLALIYAWRRGQLRWES